VDQLLAMRVFSRVAERGSFARAADELDLSRPAASAHVAALERHLGVRLLHRTTRRVSLTAEGESFLPRCQRILAELRDAEESLRGTRTRPEGRLRVEVPVVFGHHLLVPALPEFTRRYPHVELEVRMNDRVVDLVAEGVDVAMRVGPVRQSGLVVRRIAQMRLVTCASPGYLAEHGEPSTPGDLGQHRLLGLASASGAPPEWHFPPPYTSRRLALRFGLVFNSAEAPVRAAVAGLGITQTVDLVIADDVARGTLRPVLQEYSVPGPPLSLVFPSGGRQSPKVRVFADFAADLLLRWHAGVRERLDRAPSAPVR
jgi:LysR family transcriptional regulator, regulator for bpeEF and oprC